MKKVVFTFLTIIINLIFQLETQAQTNSIKFTDISWPLLNGLWRYNLTQNPNTVKEGTIVIYKTNDGRFGKLEVLEATVTCYPRFNKKLRIKFVTYSHDGKKVHSQNENLMVSGRNADSWKLNLDSSINDFLLNENWADFRLVNDMKCTKKFIGSGRKHPTGVVDCISLT